jgi:hypothetical protein
MDVNDLLKVKGVLPLNPRSRQYISGAVEAGQFAGEDSVYGFCNEGFGAKGANYFSLKVQVKYGNEVLFSLEKGGDVGEVEHNLYILDAKGDESDGIHCPTGNSDNLARLIEVCGGMVKIKGLSPENLSGLGIQANGSPKETVVDIGVTDSTEFACKVYHMIGSDKSICYGANNLKLDGNIDGNRPPYTHVSDNTLITAFKEPPLALQAKIPVDGTRNAKAIYGPL